MLVFLYRLYRCRGGHLWIWSQHVNNAFSVGLILKICAHKFRDSPTHLMLTLQTRLISATFGIMFFFAFLRSHSLRMLIKSIRFFSYLIKVCS